MTGTISHTTWLETARRLAPIVEQYRDAAARERRLPAAVLAAARAIGLPRMLLPRALGGAQAGIDEAMLAIEELARQDGSIGWNLAFSVLSPLFSDYLAEDAAQAIFGTGDTIMAGTFAPRGHACRVPGGYRLSGRWNFASGCQNADLFVAGGLVFDGEQPELGPDGAPAPRMFVFPVAAGSVIDTWDTVGMRGTGSHDFAVDGLFVPDEHAFPFQAFFCGPSPRPGLGYPRPFFEMGPLCLAAVGLGVARAAIDAFRVLATTKTAQGATQRLAEQPIIHERVGRAEAQWQAAHAYLLATARAVAVADAGAPPMVVPVRLAAAHAAHSAVEIVNLLYQAAGGTSVYETSPLARDFRDVNTLTHHFVMAAPGSFVTAGEWLLNRAAS